MSEELGISRHQILSFKLLRPAALYRRTYSFVGEDYIDNEFIACFGAEIDVAKCAIKIDENEVAKIKWVEKQWILDELENNPQQYTPWFQDEKALI